MGMPDHLTYLLRNLYAGQEATLRTVHGTTDWFQIRKGVHQGCILSPCLFKLYAEYIIRNTGLDEVGFPPSLRARLPAQHVGVRHSVREKALCSLHSSGQ